MYFSKLIMNDFFVQFQSFLQSYPEKDIEKEWSYVKQKGWITIDKHYCFLCKYSCNSRTTMYSHIKIHSKWNKQLSLIKQQKKTYVCRICYSTYTCKRNTRRHIQESHLDIPKNIVNQLICNTLETIQNETNDLPRTYSIKQYLQTECSAISFHQCIKEYPFSIKDIHLIEWMGVRGGYSLLIKTMLQSYSIQQRPLHCTDKKRLIFYVMEKTGWTRDYGKRLNIWIDELKYRLIQCINQWVKQQEHSVSEKATSYIRAVCMGDTPHDETLNKKRIIQSIAPFVYLSKQDLE